MTLASSEERHKSYQVRLVAVTVLIVTVYGIVW